MSSRAEKSLWDSLQPPESISFLKAAGGWILVTGAVLLLLWVTGPIVSNLFSFDTIGHVEAGNRVLHGQRLNVDFIASHWGPLYVWLVAVGIRLSGSASPLALHWAQALAVIFLGTLLYLVALPRLRLPWALFLLLAADLLLILSTPLGRTVWSEFSYAMYYNAMCFVPLAALFVSLLIPRRESTLAGCWCDVLLESFSLALLFSLKAWFAFGALPAYVLIRCLWPRPGEKRFWGLIGLALFAVLAVALSEPGGGWRPYLSILKSAAGSNINPVLLPMRFLPLSRTWSTALLAVLIALLFAHYCAMPWRRLLQMGLYSLAATGAFMLGTSSSAQNLDTIPFLGVVPLASVLFAARTAGDQKTPLERLGLYAALLIAVLLLAQDPKNSLLSRTFLNLSVKTYHTAKLEDSQVDPRIAATDPVFLKYYNDIDKDFRKNLLFGIDLLRTAKVPQTEVLWIDTDYGQFNHIVGNPPPKGSIVFCLVNAGLPPARHPLLRPSSFMEDTQWVLKIKELAFDWQVVMCRPDRKAYFESHFAQVGENERWILYHRTAP